MICQPPTRQATRVMLAAALVPAIAINLCYLIAAAQSLIPTCVPYLHGCTSISSTGRHGVTFWLFKATMLPQAVLLFVFWRALAQQLDAPRAMRGFGQAGALFLVLYVVFLGADHAAYRLMRRYGVFVYFIGTFVAMVLASRHMIAARPGQASVRLLAILCTTMLCLGLMEAPLGQFGVADNRAENLIEWNFALLMQCWFLTIWRLFAQPEVNQPPD